ncbi:MAG: cytochrome C, partial [Sedimenticolaceae bacterium]|nr:cytochrome C [Sedimenticolaceae bacterium]
APKEEALDCVSCHAANARLAGLTGFYMPGRDKNSILDFIGWLAVVGTLGGVLLHGTIRLIANRRRDS